MTRKITPGFPVPEERLNPLPFYWRHQSPEIIRWEWLHWQYDARQRKFYHLFTGRTQGSIWRDECYPPNLKVGPDVNLKRALAGDPRAWSMPHIDTTTGYQSEHAAFSNFLEMHRNYRPTNPYTGRSADATDVDHIYIAPRVTFDSAMYRIDMNLPAPTELAGLDYFIGYEVNSQGSTAIICIRYDGTAGTWNLVATSLAHYDQSYGYGGITGANVIPITINNTGTWCNYAFIWDPPVFRFVQPTSGNTSFATNPDMIEVSLPSCPRTAVMQPFIANESSVITTSKQWLVGQWAINPIYHQTNLWDIRKRLQAIEACGDYEVIWDTGGRGHILVYIEGLGTADEYEIYWCGSGQNQRAGSPEARTWRRIDDRDWTGILDENGIVSKGLFNAARFLKIKLSRTNWADTVRTQEVVALTANRT